MSLTFEQVDKHRECIEWFYAEEGRTVMYILPDYYPNRKWLETTNPTWNTDKIYVPNDEYVEFRMAKADGKVVQIYVNRLDQWYWRDITDDLSNYPINELRIKPEEPEFKVGDYVKNIKDDRYKPFIVTQQWINNTLDQQDMFRLWTLEETSDDEWVKVIHSNHIVTIKKELLTGSEIDKYKIVPDIGQTPEQLVLES